MLRETLSVIPTEQLARSNTPSQALSPLVPFGTHSARAKKDMVNRGEMEAINAVNFVNKLVRL